LIWRSPGSFSVFPEIFFVIALFLAVSPREQHGAAAEHQGHEHGNDDGLYGRGRVVFAGDPPRLSSYKQFRRPEFSKKCAG